MTPSGAHEGHTVHLGYCGATACRQWSKYCTGSPAAVTCEACQATWAFAVACRDWPVLNGKEAGQ